MRPDGFKRLSTDDKKIVAKEKQKLCSEYIFAFIHWLQSLSLCIAQFNALYPRLFTEICEEVK